MMSSSSTASSWFGTRSSLACTQFLHSFKHVLVLVGTAEDGPTAVSVDLRCCFEKSSRLLVILQYVHFISWRFPGLQARHLGNLIGVREFLWFAATESLYFLSADSEKRPSRSCLRQPLHLTLWFCLSRASFNNRYSVLWKRHGAEAVLLTISSDESGSCKE